MSVMTEPTLVLRRGREKSVLRRHPWVFAGAVADAQAGAGAIVGGTVVVRASDGRFLGRAAYNPDAPITARMLTFDEDEVVHESLVLGRLERAVLARHGLDAVTDAQRLVFAESDRLPGLVVDRYGPVVVCQFLTAGAEQWRTPVVSWLAGRPGVEAVVERSDTSARRREGLADRSGVLAGEWDAARRVEVFERSLAAEGRGDGRWSFVIDVAQGHKTGFYLDQRDSRQLVSCLAPGRRVLDVFAYTGGFSVAAGRAGAASVTTVDSSRPALAVAAENLRANGLSDAGLVQADAFQDLRRRRDAGERFDLIVLDPPKLAHSEAQVARASRAYKDINWLACRLLEPGGMLVTFSCSAAIAPELFQKIVFGAALDAGADLQVVGRLSQPADHPVLLTVPETAYLKGLVCRRL
ncbi:MAG: rRNA (cytosine1962-C5)-methyltransferase [Acidimicrobiia bacterium]|nr:rRNA (cytosine1962-C5)-methyltransferase [Acidimicrobiia bacterium]